LANPQRAHFETFYKAITMTTELAIIGLGIMGQQMLTQMRRHQNFEPEYLGGPNPSTCQKADMLDPHSQIMDSASNTISKSDLVYLACPPAVRKAYAFEAPAACKALFLEKPFGINTDDRTTLMAQLKAYNVPITVNFTQESGTALADLLAAHECRDIGTLV
jgi:predicted dehydrogenase